MTSEPPLHQAIIDDNLEKTTLLAKDQQVLYQKNQFDFTPIELAQLLGREKCYRILQPSYAYTIKIQLKGKTDFEVLTPEKFKEKIGIHYRPWNRFENYSILKSAIKNCPLLLRWKWSGSENQEMGKRYQDLFLKGYTVDLVIKWIDESIGYGLFANQDIADGEFVGEYTGVVRRTFRKHPDLNEYCFQYPTKYWSWKYFVIDALKEGNYLRFANHSDRPTMQPSTAMDRGLLHQIFFTTRKIKKGTELTFDYGTDFWLKRKKITYSNCAY